MVVVLAMAIPQNANAHSKGVSLRSFMSAASVQLHAWDLQLLASQDPGRCRLFQNQLLDYNKDDLDVSVAVAYQLRSLSNPSAHGSQPGARD